VLLGLLAVAAVPAGVAAAEVLDRVELVHVAAAVPVGIVVGVAALVLSGRAGREIQITIGRVGGARLVRLGRLLGFLGIYLALTAALAFGFYAVLTLFAD
jgi:hypothetical protein